MPRKSKEDQEGIIFETEEYYFFAAELIERYLGEKRYFIGGPIPKARLLSIQSIQTVLRTEFDFAVQFVHDNCIPKLPPTPDHSDNSVPWEVDYMLKMLYELGSLEVPKRFRGGLMLLYFKFCKGHSIPDPPEIDSIMELCNKTLS